jgi:hypothetical protein
MNDESRRHEEPQSERGERGSRSVGSPGASEGAGRDSGVIEDHDLPSTDPDQLDAPEPKYTTEIGDAEAAIPPYEGRTAEHDDDRDSQRNAPETTDSGEDAVQTSGEESSPPSDSTEDSDPGVGPAHQSGVPRAEDQS